MAALPIRGEADEGPALRPATRQADADSRSTRGSTLKWLPHHDSGAQPVVQVANTEPVGPRTAMRTSDPHPPALLLPGNVAMADPFGDQEGIPRTLPRGTTAESAPADPLPGPLPSPLPPPLEPEPALPHPDTAYPNGEMFPPGTMRGALPPPRGAAGPGDLRRKCPSKDDREFADFFKTIKDLSIDIAAKDGEFPQECEMRHDTYSPRSWIHTDFTWKASGLCHKPLYFEDRNLERYGQSAHPLLQPVLSGAHFFATIPILPYKMGLEPPTECLYTLGYYRPGSCAPHLLDPIPLSVRAGLFQAGAVAGAVAIIP